MTRKSRPPSHSDWGRASACFIQDNCRTECHNEDVHWLTYYMSTLEMITQPPIIKIGKKCRGHTRSHSEPEKCHQPDLFILWIRVCILIKKNWEQHGFKIEVLMIVRTRLQHWHWSCHLIIFYLGSQGYVRNSRQVFLPLKEQCRNRDFSTT